MSYFDTITPRRGTNCYKWDTPENEDILAMWVADMDFRTAPAVIEALSQRVSHGIFGYTRVPPEYYTTIDSWFTRRHGWSIAPGSVIYVPGVVPALSAIIKALTEPGEKVMVQCPAYNCFFSSIRNNGVTLAPNMLINDSGRYTIDLDSLERLASDPKASVMILCNPHNPVGRLWTREELTAVARICRDNNVTVISDEIHCELTYERPYNPFGPIATEEGCRWVTCCSPSKAFNTAGLQIANIVCPDDSMRRRIDRAVNDNEVCDVNPFGVVGLMAAYNESESWLDELTAYLWENYRYARDAFSRELPALTISPLEATYLMWIDITPTGMTSDKLAEMMVDKARVMVSPGTIYGPGGERHIRLNIATPRAILANGLDRIISFLKSVV